MINAAAEVLKKSKKANIYKCRKREQKYIMLFMLSVISV